MPIPSNFVVANRAVSFSLVVLAASLLDVQSFSYRSIFVGLLFAHFFLGFYYSRGNIEGLKQKKYALALGSAILLVGLYFSMQQVRFAPHFLIVHTALSDAYLLTLGTRLKDGERMKLLKTGFYVICFSLLFLEVTTATVPGLVGLGLLGAIGLAAIFFYSENKATLGMFELPLVGLVLFAKMQHLTFDIHFLGFYHILTWYVFSFWMLFVKERNVRKTASFFSMVAGIAAMFVVLFDRVLGTSITDLSFARIIGFWSILHITSSIPLSKFNPRFLKNLFYPAVGRP